MRLPEQKLWDNMRTAMEQSRVLMYRIENPIIPGLADVIALYDGITTWVELKQTYGYPSRASTPVLGDSNGLSVEQKNFHVTWHQRGGRSYVLIGVGEGRGREVWLIPGRFADSVNFMTAIDFCTYSVAKGWEAVEGVLKGEKN